MHKATRTPAWWSSASCHAYVSIYHSCVILLIYCPPSLCFSAVYIFWPFAAVPCLCAPGSINAKLGGTNARLAGEPSDWVPGLQGKRLMVMGADVSRGAAATLGAGREVGAAAPHGSACLPVGSCTTLQ